MGLRHARTVFARAVYSLLLLAFLSISAYGHGPDPKVIALSSSTGPGDGIHALTTNQGILVYLNFEYKWVCEDAIHPFARTNALVIDDQDPSQWLVATNYGVHRSIDGGCDFSAVDHPLAHMRAVGLWPRPNGQRTVVAAENDEGESTLFWSDDMGRTWQAFPVHASGRVLSIRWVTGDSETMLVHHSGGLSVRDVEGQILRELTITDAQLEIPFDSIRHVDISPVNVDVMLAVVQVAERSRILRTADGGRIWQTVGLFDEPDVQIMFNGSDGRVIGIGRLGGRWSSDDFGSTWRIDESGEPTIGCLYRRDASDTIYACGNPYAGGPWALGRSTDFGQTWTPLLAQVEDASHRKDCGDEDRTYLCCRGRCPGNQMSCGQPNFVMWPDVCYDEAETPISDAGLSMTRSDAGIGLDATMPALESDGGETPQDDAGLRPPPEADATSNLDATHASTAKGSGCSQAAGEDNRWPLWSIYLLVLLLMCKPIHIRG
ncbi:MAG: hypothetical protein CMH52_06760 [Myxococcales bacterium]|nr:hypothetical protein [Myxococcales bacterium]|tara:strand:- start:1603 stop:3072 length:1470 start_codon:yes stop_codon:yes gene_type:complete